MNQLRRLVIAVFVLFLVGSARSIPVTTRHYAPNGNFDSQGRYVPGDFGFNISDIRTAPELDRLPDDVLGLVWVGRCSGADDGFVAAVKPFVNHPKVFGFYLMDDPDPRMLHERRCAPEKLKAEADWIRSHAPGAKTFIALMNLESSRHPSFMNSYNPENSHVDFFAINPYPCRTELKGCDFDMINRFVDAAIASGIPANRIVPGYQTFGGGKWVDDGDGQYMLPSEREESEILARWSARIGRSVFDYAYSWGAQRDDNALENSPGIRAVLARHNGAARY